MAITKYLIKTAHALGISKPKVAIIAASEQINPKIPASVDATIIAKMVERGQIKGAMAEGPLALDLAISKEAAEIKKMESEGVGN